MFVILCFGILMMAQDQPYVVILKNNKTMKAVSRPELNGRFYVITLKNGSKTTLPAKIVDLERSDAYNKKLADEAEAARLAAQAAAEKEAEDRAKELEKGKTASLRRTEDLKPFDRSQGTAGAVISNSEAVIGTPEERTWTSDDPVYLALERRTVYESKRDVYCEFGLNVNSVENVKILMSVAFSDRAPMKLEQTIPSIQSGGRGITTFVLPKEGDIVQIGYVIDWDEITVKR